MVQVLGVELEYERVQQEYLSQKRRGIPMSVREWYEWRLAELRVELRNTRHRRPLGEILIEMGAIDHEQLAQALSEQAKRGGQALLGEILIELGWVDEETIHRAVVQQLAPV